jgi:hypothetical protein
MFEENPELCNILFQRNTPELTGLFLANLKHKFYAFQHGFYLVIYIVLLIYWMLAYGHRDPEGKGNFQVCSSQLMVCLFFESSSVRPEH